jgi:hypothetical protein
MMRRRTCSRARNARHGSCQAVGCDHACGTRQRICGCCAVRLGRYTADRLSLARQYMKHEAYVALEDELLAKLATMPRAVPLPDYRRPT